MPLHYYENGVEQFVVGDPRFDEGGADTGALRHGRALLARAADASTMIYIGGSSTAAGGSSAGAKRFGDRLLDTLQNRYPSGLGTETPVTYGANTRQHLRHPPGEPRHVGHDRNDQ